MNEHGWNDPPAFTYSSLQTKSGSGKRTQLNKRVNHDLYTPSTSHPTHSSLSTHCTSGPPTNNLPDKKSKQPQQDPQFSPDPAEGVVVRLESVMEGLERVIESHKQIIPDRTVTEVKSRLKMMVDQWKNDRLSEEVKVQMTELSKALEEGHYSVADEIHVNLMVDHVSEVSRWMVGVKKLITLINQQSD